MPSCRNLLTLLKRPHKPDPVLTKQHHFASLLYCIDGLWTPCTIALHNTSVSVAWEAHSKDISLKTCSDVRSVTSDDELKVFELTFKDSSKERFAVDTVRERAKWISLFWDAVLPSGTSPKRSLPPLPPAATPKVSFDDTLQFVGNMSRTSTSKTLPLPPPLSPLNPSRYSSASTSTLPVPPSPASSKSGGKRKWPPPVNSNASSSDSRAGVKDEGKIMEEKEPTSKRISMFTKIPLDPDGVPSHIRASSSPHTPKTPNNTLDTPAPLRPPTNTPASSSRSGKGESTAGNVFNSGTKSTSIANLSRLSVVKTRLAAMESQSSSPSSPFTQELRSSRTRSKQTTPLREDTRAKGRERKTVQTPDGLPAPSASAVPPPLPSKGVSASTPTAPSNQPKDETRNVSDVLEVKVNKAGGAAEGVVRVLHQEPHLPGSDNQVKEELAKIHAKLHEMHQSQLKNTNTLAGVGASGVPLREGEVKERLGALERVGKETKEIVRGLAAKSGERGILEELTSLHTLLESLHAEHVQQGATQADSVRYLNELNGWLEAFLRQAEVVNSNSSSRNADDAGQAESDSLLQDVGQLLRGMKARDQSMATLQAAVNDLVVGLQTTSRSAVDGSPDANRLTHMIETQRREQEAMLRVFTDEISDEIKGERLRFVEAMREATAINVQHHVSELKKEMGKEVFVMARQVERLHRDKQDVEQRIAELMDFYSKQTLQTSNPPAAVDYTTGLLGFGTGMHAQAHHHNAAVASGIPMLALSSEPTYMPPHYPQPPRPSKAATLDNAGYYSTFDSAKLPDNSGLETGAGLLGKRSHFDDFHDLQGPSSSQMGGSGRRPFQHQQQHQQGQQYQQYEQQQQQQIAIGLTAAPTSASRYQGTGNGIGGVGGAGPGASGVRSYGGTMKPVIDLRMKPLGSGRRAATSSVTPTPSGSRGLGGQGGGGKLKEPHKPSTRRK